MEIVIIIYIREYLKILKYIILYLEGKGNIIKY